ncbi:tail fiber domain-containing protein [Pyxidicoccus parkwayensis]|uniref:Tail fiber domain-containing protein n=1 Tax=Pyxidicoccus parkwayensis TaxID=2813578 RepID=A0ABX7NQR5_9BACT|nr:tail fiber domain-containing protein [Pyxidicoccus parkwaysis]QSQ21207.1 tail fiber domain-containing protein [Pyxidicoccus parkwaysis]
MKVRTLLAALGCIAVSTGGCGSEGPQGDQGPQGPKGDPGQSWQVGDGLKLDGNVLSVRYGSETTAAVQGSDPRLNDARAPLPGSGSYIQNGSTVQDASFSVGGTGTATGRLTTKADLRVEATTSVQAPTPLLRVENTATSPAWNNFPVFTVDSAGGLLSRGELGYGTIPMTGKGLRLMWYPYKAAFRAGNAETQWDDANVGFNSWAGGNLTTASGFGTFAFGDQCTASGVDAVCFGSSNTASGTVSLSTGASNTASGFSSVALGYTNVAGGQGSVAIGYRVSATGDYTMALGHRVSTAGFDGSFIWGDQSTTNVASSTASNQFMLRASGGVRLRTNSTLTTGCDLPAGSGVFSCTSDRNQKEDFQHIDGEAVLAKVARMPVQSWRYKEEGQDVRHLGPVAQDFRAAFGLGTDDKSIGLLDIDGVNMAAIQALERRTQELRAKTAEVDALKAELAELKQGLSRLESAIQAQRPAAR